MNGDIVEWLKANAIDEIEALVPDLAGVARGKFIPANKFLAQDIRLPESIFIQAVNGEYVDMFETDRDMVLKPDLKTFRVVPWAIEKTACVIGDCFKHSGQPIEIAPREVLRKVLAAYDANGWKPLVAPEVEFYLVKQNTDPDYPLEPPVGRSGRQEAAGKPFSIDAVNEFDPVFEDIYDFCEAMRIGAESLSHEDGAGQLEVNFNHGDPLELADQVFLFKRLVRETALKHGMYATFMAKPMGRQPGSALHLHQSVVSVSDGRNLFGTPDGGDTPLFRHFIAGQQRYVPECLAIFGPYVNSYRRFTRYYSAPINVHWGYDNRTVGLRVPASGWENRRVENRVAGADVNPYLAIAASLACGYLGMVERLTPTDPLEGSAYQLPGTLSRDPASSLEALRTCKPIRNLLGEAFIDIYCEIKRIEHDTYFQVISPWEREFLLLNV
jgi:glutamine synthetase